MGKRKKMALKKGAIPSIFNFPLNTSENAECDSMVPASCRKELFGELPSKRLCTTVSSQVCL